MSRRFTLVFLFLGVATGVGFSEEVTPEGRAVDAALTSFHAAAA